MDAAVTVPILDSYLTNVSLTATVQGTYGKDYSAIYAEEDLCVVLPEGTVSTVTGPDSAQNRHSYALLQGNSDASLTLCGGGTLNTAAGQPTYSIPPYCAGIGSLGTVAFSENVTVYASGADLRYRTDTSGKDMGVDAQMGVVVRDSACHIAFGGNSVRNSSGITTPAALEIRDNARVKATGGKTPGALSEGVTAGELIITGGTLEAGGENHAADPGSTGGTAKLSG